MGKLNIYFFCIKFIVKAGEVDVMERVYFFKGKSWSIEAKQTPCKERVRFRPICSLTQMLHGRDIQSNDCLFCFTLLVQIVRQTQLEFVLVLSIKLYCIFEHITVVCCKVRISLRFGQKKTFIVFKCNKQKGV